MSRSPTSSDCEPPHSSRGRGGAVRAPAPSDEGGWGEKSRSPFPGGPPMPAAPAQAEPRPTHPAPFPGAPPPPGSARPQPPDSCRRGRGGVCPTQTGAAPNRGRGSPEDARLPPTHPGVHRAPPPPRSRTRRRVLFWARWPGPGSQAGEPHPRASRATWLLPPARWGKGRRGGGRRRGWVRAGGRASGRASERAASPAPRPRVPVAGGSRVPQAGADCGRSRSGEGGISRVGASSATPPHHPGDQDGATVSSPRQGRRKRPGAAEGAGPGPGDEPPPGSSREPRVGSAGERRMGAEASSGGSSPVSGVGGGTRTRLGSLWAAAVAVVSAARLRLCP